jgi:hypothetical protein
MTEFNAGDLVVFSGLDPYSRLVVQSQMRISRDPDRSQYTHVGIIIKIAEELHLLESTTGCRIPDIGGIQRDGVSLRTIRSRVVDTRKRGERIWVARRKKPLTPSEENKLSYFYLSVCGRGYDYIQAIKAAMNLRQDTPMAFLSNRADLSLLFCSELVAAAELFVSGSDTVYHPHGHLLNPSEVLPMEVLHMRYHPSEPEHIWGDLDSILHLYAEDDEDTGELPTLGTTQEVTRVTTATTITTVTKTTELTES